MASSGSASKRNSISSPAPTAISPGFTFCLSLRRLADPVFDRLAGRVHSLPHCAPGLLVQHPAARRRSLLELELRDPREPACRGRAGRDSSRRGPPHRDRAAALRRRRRTLFSQYLLQHRRHCPGAGELRHRPKILLGTFLKKGSGQHNPRWLELRAARMPG